MPLPSKQISTEKENLHPRNAHRQGYDFEQLIRTTPELRPFVKLNQYNIESIDFSDSEAVKVLGEASRVGFLASLEGRGRRMMSWSGEERKS